MNICEVKFDPLAEITMILNSRTLARLVLALGLLNAAQAQTLHDKLITFVVPYASGSVNDIAGWIVGTKMSKILGVPISIGNKPGANTIIGAMAVSKAAPTSYTLLPITAATTAQNPLIYKQLFYTPDEFAPVPQVTHNGKMYLITNPTIPAKTLKEFVEKSDLPKKTIRSR